MYEKGRGVEKDDKKACEWYLKAAEQGHEDAQFNLGLGYAIGLGVEKDNKKAREWYLKAAHQGNAAAQNNLGWIYENGQGVNQDILEAAKWYFLSAEQGEDTAIKNFNILYQTGKVTEREARMAAENEKNRWMSKKDSHYVAYVECETKANQLEEKQASIAPHVEAFKPSDTLSNPASSSTLSQKEVLYLTPLMADSNEKVNTLKVKTQNFGSTETAGFRRPVFLICHFPSMGLALSDPLKNYRENRENGTDQDNPKTPFPSAGFDALDVKECHWKSFDDWPDKEY